MNLEELKHDVDFAISQLHEYENPKDIEVLITLSEWSAGARASSEVSCAGIGSDWEHGQFRIEPVKNLVRKGHNFQDEKDIICLEYNGRKYYKCPRCKGKITKRDKYCRHCGQTLKELEV